MSVAEILMAVLPLVSIAYLMVARYWPATRAMPVAWVVAVLVGIAGWGMSTTWVAAATISGFITAAQILFIVFGAVLLLYTLKQTGAFDAINAGFASVSEDRRVQVVLLVFLMGSFIEGAAGFGTPAAVVGPLLVGLGFPPLAAVVVALTGNIMAITFGAVGTPLVIGLEDVFSESAMVTSDLAATGMTVHEWVAQIAVFAATYHAIVGIALPFIGVAMMTRFFGEERSIEPALDALPLCLFAWASFAVPYWLTAYFLGPVFPGLLGAMIGLVVTVSVLKLGYLHPDEEWDFGPQENWPEHWTGDIEPGETSSKSGAIAADGGIVTAEMPLWKAWTPYVGLAALLVATRTIGPLTDFLQSTLVLVWQDILGTGLSGSFAFLYLPGAVFLAIHLLTIPLHGMSKQEITSAWTETIQKVAPATVALLFAVGTVQIMIQSGTATGGQSMLQVLSTATANTAGGIYPFFAPLVGAFGAFLAGSNTVSDILFGTFQYGVATELGVSRTVLVGAQAVGGAIGNLIAVHNVVAALAVVGLVGQEGRVIRYELIPLAYYATATGILVMLFSYVVFPSTF
ncbi:L-lactate permease [Halospeciosus flavus]|uniref:L-lactate permease n=1 Tax=Halospeciosus flavus TaxID=3032283 RepID=A0ABD5Z5H6_9EURY|nr:L-lactate permease [Halospeciosus flavus]